MTEKFVMIVFLLFAAAVVFFAWCVFRSRNKELRLEKRKIFGKLLKCGQRVRIVGMHPADMRTLGQVGCISGFQYGGTMIDVKYNLDDEVLYEVIHIDDAMNHLLILADGED